MAEVIQLESFKRKQAATRGFKSWSKRFGDRLDEQTRLSDLSDNTLLFLISPGDQNIFALYELVMGVSDDQCCKLNSFFVKKVAVQISFC